MSEANVSTHDKILHAGLGLMSSSGLSGVTLGVLADRVGMSKSGLFAHFRSKEAVQIELLEFMTEFADEHVVASALKADPGLPRLRALVVNWFGWAERAGLPGGCPVAAALFEFDDAEGAVRDKILEMERAWRGFLHQLATEAVEHGHFRSDLDVEQFVWELSGIYLSHHAAHRFLRAADADVRAERAFDQMLERSLPETANRDAVESAATSAGKRRNSSIKRQKT